MIDTIPAFTELLLETGPDGRARWREQSLLLSEGKPMARLSPLTPSSGFQFRESPIDFPTAMPRHRVAPRQPALF